MGARLEREEGNFRQALRWALERGRGDGEALELGLRLAGALGWFWFLHGYPAEAREWLTVLLRPPAAAPGAGAPEGAGGVAGLPAAVRARALNAAGFRAIDHGEYDLAVTFHEQALAAWTGLGDTRGTVAALHGLADASLWRGDAAPARARYEEGLALARAAGTADDVALFLFHLGQLWWLEGDPARAQDYGEQALATARAAGSSTWAPYALFVLASVAHERRDPQEAGARYREAVALAGASGDRLGLRMMLAGPRRRVGDGRRPGAGPDPAPAPQRRCRGAWPPSRRCAPGRTAGWRPPARRSTPPRRTRPWPPGGA